MNVLKSVVITYHKQSFLKPNFAKNNVLGIGFLKGVKISIFGIKSVDLTSDTFSYNKTLQNDMNFLKAKNRYLKQFKAVENAKSNPGRKNYPFQRLWFC